MAFPVDMATLSSRRSRTHIPPETRQMSQSAMPATQNDMSTSSDTWRKRHLCGFPNRHGNFSATTVVHTHSSSHTSTVTKCHACKLQRHEHISWHVECHKVPHWPRKTASAHLLARGERDVFAASPIDTATFLPRRSCTHIPPETRQMSQNVKEPRKTT